MEGTFKAPLIDAGSGALAGTLSGGNIKTLFRAPELINNSSSLSELTFNILNSYSAGSSLVSVGQAVDSYMVTETTYTVKKGDTLSGISKREGVSIQQIIKDNNIKDPHKIKTNQTLSIQK